MLIYGVLKQHDKNVEKEKLTFHKAAYAYDLFLIKFK